MSSTIKSMLRKSLSGLLLPFVFVSVSNAQQTVVSSCSAPDSVVSRYQNDADRLSVRTCYAQQRSDTNQIKIIRSLSDTFLHALLAVYNATALPARDTVVTMFQSAIAANDTFPSIPGIFIFGIHTIFYKPALQDIVLNVDQQAPWVIQLSQNNIPTGNAAIDSLMDHFQLTLQGIEYGLFNTFYIHLKADSNLNLHELARILSGVSGVYQVTEGLSAQGGESPNDITATIQPSYIDLIYRHAWGDCPSGCTSRRFWEFKVFPDCSVEYVGSYGDTFYPSGILQSSMAKTATVYPNPFSEFVKVKGFSKNSSYMLFNAVGQQVLKGTTSNGTITGLAKLSDGNYWLRIKDKQNAVLFKLVKRN